MVRRTGSPPSTRSIRWRCATITSCPPPAPTSSAASAASVRAVQDTLRRVFGTGWDVRPQLPVALDDVSEPEPDMTVVPGSYRDYRRGHPARPALVVEIADATLMRDRRKGGLYARAGVG